MEQTDQPPPSFAANDAPDGDPVMCRRLPHLLADGMMRWSGGQMPGTPLELVVTSNPDDDAALFQTYSRCMAQQAKKPESPGSIDKDRRFRWMLVRQ